MLLSLSHLFLLSTPGLVAGGLHSFRATDDGRAFVIPPPHDVAAAPLPRTIASLSIESCYIIDYLGDVNAPNKLSLQLLQNIQDLSGEPPIIRVGGHTQDAARYCSNCTETITNIYEPGNDEAVNVTFNANLFKVLNENVPSDQKITFGLNLAHNDVAYPIAEVQAAEQYLDPSRLLSYELGNEPDFYSEEQRSPWNVEIYAAQIVEWMDELSKYTDADWQVGALAQLPIYQENFSLPVLNDLGVPAAVKNFQSYSDHTYPFSMCDEERAKLVSLPNLMDHNSTVSYFKQWEPSIAATRAVGASFHMGETGSVSCHGKDGVSNTLGAALWELDYVLHGAIMGMSGVYFHMGTSFYYSMWQPIDYHGVETQVYPTYYTLLLLASAMSTLPDAHVLSLPSSSENLNLVIYALYSSRPADKDTLPAKLVLLNLDYYSSNSTTERPTQQVDVSQLMGCEHVAVTRLTGKGADMTYGVTLGGQDWENGGNASGEKETEVVNSRIVSVGASEAIIVQVE